MAEVSVKPADRQAWILEQLTTHRHLSVDVLNEDFAEAYKAMIGATPATDLAATRQLGRDLSAMWKRKEVVRVRVGLQTWGREFPTWVYTYSLA